MTSHASPFCSSFSSFCNVPCYWQHRSWWPQGFLNWSGVEGCSEPACWWRRCFNDLCFNDTSSPSALPSREPPPLGMHVPPWQNMHQANSPAPFLHLTGGSRNPAMRSNGALSLKAWQMFTLQGSPKPRRAGQGTERHQGHFQKQRAAGS